MAKTSSSKDSLSATLWSLVFAVCLALAAAHLVVSAREQAQEQTGLIEATFTKASDES